MLRHSVLGSHQWRPDILENSVPKYWLSAPFNVAVRVSSVGSSAQKATPFCADSRT